MLALLLLLQQPAAPRPTDAQIIHAVDSVAGRGVDGRTLVGTSVLVARRGRVLVAKGYGTADLENGVGASDRTVYRIGSITKQFTATLILQLADSGRLTLDDPIAKYLPAIPLQGHTVTIRQLLNHTSGIPSYTSIGPAFGRIARLATPPESLIALVATKPFDFEPGTEWRYDNSGYVLLGMILEKVTGRPYATLLSERIFVPLGLTDTRYCDERSVVPRRARGYARSAQGPVNADPIDMSTPFSAGALCSTVRDLFTWQQALTSGRVLAPATYRRMIRPDTLSTGRVLTYGYGLAPAVLQEHRSVGHGGAINGFASAFDWFPDDSVVVIVLGNTEGSAVDQMALRLARATLGLPTPPRPSRPLSAADRDRYVGTYRSPGGDSVQVRAAGDGLMMTDPQDGPIKLLFQGADAFRPDNDDPYTFIFVREGDRVVGMRVRVGTSVLAELRRTGG